MIKSHWKPFVFVLELQKGYGVEPRDSVCSSVTELKGVHLPSHIEAKGDTNVFAAKKVGVYLRKWL